MTLSDYDDMSAVERIGYWYDRRTRSWIIQRLDANGNQLGDATYIGSGRDDAMAEVATLTAEHGVKAVKL
jgi:hypothetical protein